SFRTCAASGRFVPAFLCSGVHSDVLLCSQSPWPRCTRTGGCHGSPTGAPSPAWQRECFNACGRIATEPMIVNRRSAGASLKGTGDADREVPLSSQLERVGPLDLTDAVPPAGVETFTSFTLGDEVLAVLLPVADGLFAGP